MITLPKQSCPARALVYSPDGALGVGCDDGSISLWDLVALEPRQTWNDHSQEIRDIAFSSDGARFASVGWDDRLLVRSGYRGVYVWEQDQLHGGGWCVAFSADGWSLAVGCGDGKSYLWHLRDKQQPIRQDLVGHTWPVNAVAFSPVDRLLATCGHDRKIRLWDAQWGTSISSRSSHDNWARTVNFSPDGRLLASGGDDCLVKLWHVASGSEQAKLAGHDDIVLRVAFTPDGRWLLSGSADGTVRLWDVETGRAGPAYDWEIGKVLGLAVAPDGLTAAASGSTGDIVIWDLDL